MKDARLVTAQTDAPPDTDTLDRFAERERLSGFETGSGLREAAIREQGGDYAGAVFAAFKELLWAYSFAKETEHTAATDAIESAFRAMSDSFRSLSGSASAKPAQDAAQSAAQSAAQASLAFLRGSYEESGALLAEIPHDEADPDGFSAWMRLVCALETAANPSGPQTGFQEADENTLRRLRASYAAMRSRYEKLPAYWYFGARNMRGENIPAYAERAINLSPNGPYAEDARALIAEFAGLSSDDGKAILSQYEIETIAVQAVKAESPEMLAALFPLAALPDNPYTLYAEGVMRGLASNEHIKNYFSAHLRAIKSDKKQTRLAERLAYIVRG
jgi:hypothetical protein